MRSSISPKAKRIAGWMALTAAVCAGALAVAIVLFFEVWWTGLIALAVSMLCGVATVLLFMAYQADRRRSMRLTEEEEEEQRIMALLEKAHPQKEETSANDTEAQTAVSDAENAREKDAERVHSDLDDAQKPTTLEMRPPLKLLTVEEAKVHMKGGDKKSENNSPNDKNEV